MPIAIVTKFVGPSNTKGSRIIATSSNGHRIVRSYEHQHDSEENHRLAAEALALKMGWLDDACTLVGGGLKTGYAWVFVQDGAPFIEGHRRQAA